MFVFFPFVSFLSVFVPQHTKFAFVSFLFVSFFSTVCTQLTVEMLPDLAGEFRQPLQILIADFAALRQTDIRDGEL